MLDATDAALDLEIAAIYPDGDHAIHPDTCTCNGCDPPGLPTSIYGDADADFDAHDVAELAAWLDREPADAWERW